MRAVFFGFVFICSVCLSQHGAAQDPEYARFAAVEIYLHSSEPVAAWQFSLNEKNGLMKVVGVENGESAAFARTPYYDREAIRLGSADKVIVADFSLADENRLPSGRTRIATIHLMLTGTGEPAYNLYLITATAYDGRVVDASISLTSPPGSEQ